MSYLFWYCLLHFATVVVVVSRLLQRYQNVKAELEAQQNLERVRMEKMVQSGGFTSTLNTSNKASKANKSIKRTSSAPTTT